MGAHQRRVLTRVRLSRMMKILVPASERSYSNSLRTTSTLVVLVVLTVVTVMYAHDATIGNVLENVLEDAQEHRSGDLIQQPPPQVSMSYDGIVSTKDRKLKADINGVVRSNRIAKRQAAFAKLRSSYRQAIDSKKKKARKEPSAPERLSDHLSSRIKRLVKERNIKYEMHVELERAQDELEQVDAAALASHGDDLNEVEEDSQIP